MRHQNLLIVGLLFITGFLMSCTLIQINFLGGITPQDSTQTFLPPTTSHTLETQVTSTPLLTGTPPALSTPTVQPQETQTSLPVVPEFINHPQPDLSVEIIPEEKVACPMDASGRYSCPMDSPLASMGCNDVQFPDKMLGGLSPHLPMIICNLRPGNNMDSVEISNAGYLWVEGGLMPVFHRLVVEQDGNIILIKDEKELRSFFAPIENEEEALSYAILVTGLDPSYGNRYFPDLRYLVPVVEDTHVTRTDQGFEINLFGYNTYGCGNHGAFTMPVSVSLDGVVDTGEYLQVDEDPRMDGMCID